MRVMTGRSTSRQPTTSDVGIGSIRQDFLADFLMRALTSLSVRGQKELKDKHVQRSPTPDSLGTVSSTSVASMSARILVILRTNKSLMSLARAVFS